MAGDTAVGEEVWRVGKDGVEPAFGIFGGNSVEQFEGVAVIKPQPVAGIVEDELGWGRSADFQIGGLGRCFGSSRTGVRRSNAAILAQGEMGWSEGMADFFGSRGRSPHRFWFGRFLAGKRFFGFGL